jgi:transposase InsO family protein
VFAEHDVPIAPSTYYARSAAPVTDAEWHDAHMANAALEVWRAHRSLYGADKLATAMRRAGYDVGRDQVARLMKIVGIEGMRRGKHQTKTTVRDQAAPRHPDLIRRAWKTPTRPDVWWVADFTYVWTLEGFVYTSFVTDVFSRRILGWRTSSSKTTPLVIVVRARAGPVHSPPGRWPVHDERDPDGMATRRDDDGRADGHERYRLDRGSTGAPPKFDCRLVG